MGRQRLRATLTSPAALLALVLALLALATLPALLGSGVFYIKDIELWFQPSREMWRAGLASGDIVWQPQLGLGQPALANPAQSTFYPGNVLLLLPDAGAASRFLAAHLLLAAVGTWTLARYLGRSPSASAVAALAFAFGGYAISMVTWSGTYILSLAWMPLVLWLGLRATDRARESLAGSALAVALLALALAAQILTVELQGVGFTVVTLGLLIAARRDRGGGWRAAAALAAALGVAVLMAMPQLLPTLSFLSESARSGGVSVAEAQRLSFHPGRMAELLVAGLYGSPLDAAFIGGFMTDGTSAVGRTPWSLSPYQGALVMPLALVGAIVAVRARDWVHVVLALVLVVALLLALGRHTPVHGLASALPGLDLFRYPAKYMAVVSLALALLAARGLDGALESERRWRRLLIGVAGLAVAAAIAAALVRLTAEAAVGVADTALLRAAALFAVSALTIALVRTRRARMGALAVLGLFVGDLAISNIGHVRLTDASLYSEPSVLGGVVNSDHGRRAHRLEWPRVVVDPSIFAAGRGVDATNTEIAAQQIKQALTPNTAIIEGLALPLPYSALLDASHRRWEQATADMRRVAMDIYGIHYAVVPGYKPRDARLGFEHLAGLPERNVALLRNRAARPFAYPADPVSFSGDRDGAYAMVHDRDRMGRRGAVIEMPGWEASDIATEIGAASGACTLLSRPRRQIELRCELDRHGWVIINASYHRGWSARVDDGPADILPANGAVMAIAVAPGSHEIRLEFQPPGLRAGLGLGALGALLLLALVVVSRLRRRRSADT